MRIFALTTRLLKEKHIGKDIMMAVAFTFGLKPLERITSVWDCEYDGDMLAMPFIAVCRPVTFTYTALLSHLYLPYLLLIHFFH